MFKHRVRSAGIKKVTRLDYWTLVKGNNKKVQIENCKNKESVTKNEIINSLYNKCILEITASRKTN